MRRTLLVVAALSWAGTADAAVTPAPMPRAAGTPMISPVALDDDMIAAEGDLASRWWDSANRHFVPSEGSGGAKNGLYDGAAPTVWQMEQIENEQYWVWKTRGSEADRRKLADNWAYMQTFLTGAQWKDATSGVSISDDAAWKALYLAHVHEATRDSKALASLGETIAATTVRFKDPSQSINFSYGRSRDGVPFSQGQYGLLYAADAESIQQYGYVSSSYQAGLAIAADYYFRQTGQAGYHAFAVDTYNLIRVSMSTPVPADAGRKARFLVETNLNLDPNVAAPTASGAGSIRGQTLTLAGPTTGTFAINQYINGPNVAPGTRITGGGGASWTVNLAQSVASATIRASLARTGIGDARQVYLSPQNAYFGKPIRGLDSTFIGGLFLEGQLAGLLFEDDGNAAYLDDINTMAAALISPQGYGRTVDGATVLCNCRDPWTDANGAPGFVQDALSRPGVDPSGAVKQVFRNTAAAILAHDRVLAANAYTADWSGPETNPSDGTTSWQAAYAAHPGNQAGYQQIMTTASSVAMALAGVMVDHRPRR